MNTGAALLISALLLAGNAFFVGAEFALVASKKHRLDQLAAAGRRGAHAALAGVRELSLMLAGAQLGITLCTLGLGALAEPAVAHLIDPLLHAIGLPSGTSYLIAFLISLALVVVLHMVVGEMAPKSWAITHPERSALLLAPPFRAFTRVTRWVIVALNAAANGLLRLGRIDPQEALAQAHGPEELRLLLEQSRQHGTIGADQHRLLTRMLALQRTTVADVMESCAGLVTVPAEAPAAEIERASLDSGRSRLAVGGTGAPTGLVHVRDAVRAVTAGTPATAAELASPLMRLPPDRTVIAAVADMQARRAQLALVGEAGAPVGFVALEDLLEEIIGEFYDETDVS